MKPEAEGLTQARRQLFEGSWGERTKEEEEVEYEWASPAKVRDLASPQSSEETGWEDIQRALTTPTLHYRKETTGSPGREGWAGFLAPQTFKNKWLVPIHALAGSLRDCLPGSWGNRARGSSFDCQEVSGKGRCRTLLGLQSMETSEIPLFCPMRNMLNILVGKLWRCHAGQKA